MIHSTTRNASPPSAHAQQTAGSEPADILRMMEAHHSALLRMCAMLEEIADSLPFSIDVGRCLEAARSLPTVVAAASHFEEATLWPWAETVVGADERFDSTLRRLRDEHRDDEDFAQELSGVLMDWGMSRARPNPETTGYMLRGFFVGLRRHVAFEAEFLVRPLRIHITAATQPSAS